MTVRGQKLPDGYYTGEYDWKTYAAVFISLCESYGRSWYTKHTLWKHMPVVPYTPTDEFRFRPMCHPKL